MDERPDVSVPQTVDEATLLERAATARALALIGPWLLGGLLARSVYRSTCDGRLFYGGAAGPADLADIIFTAFCALLSWEIEEPLARSGFASLVVLELIRWRWTFTGIPASQWALWGTYLISSLLLTIAAIRGSNMRRQALAVALFAGAFALAWVSASWWSSFRAYARCCTRRHGAERPLSSNVRRIGSNAGSRAPVAQGSSSEPLKIVGEVGGAARN